MQILNNAPLSHLNTFGLDAQAKKLLILDDKAQLDALPAVIEKDEPLLPLGGGSNVLFCEDFQGAVLLNRLKGIEVRETEEAWLLHVAAGESWPALVDWTLAKGMGGLENLTLIPGTVGAAPIQNIGAYGLELAPRCDYVDFLDLTTGEQRRLTASECHFGYRDSIFKQELKGQTLITAVGLRLEKAWQAVLDYAPLTQLAYDEVTPHQVSELVKTVRTTKLPDPSQLGNAGSFYKNPTITRTSFEALKELHPDLPGFVTGPNQVKVPAAWFIDKAGWKGQRLGGAGVHEHQALVLVNHGQAKAAEVLELARSIRMDVQAKFGVLLTPEIRLIGASGEITL
ncbi:UDP-N-acetylmuramate dehydrogenase [Gallaecimonas kandeliae]|uniref:UDP-N-acetylmuramate dehydrogenase n=1 Tax=Gallaecimonas kandeliae TaxID=3029055 RepID=UPI00264993CF|nr:UDP-N-acetylmuramate dehydrogenase [Gallaecimonas kandeliae]WKE65956.1 UDP-N-acetylmuramate dehydrogenase [Gallaecimonas kandeliae]